LKNILLGIGACARTPHGDDNVQPLNASRPHVVLFNPSLDKSWISFADKHNSSVRVGLNYTGSQ